MSEDYKELAKKYNGLVDRYNQLVGTLQVAPMNALSNLIFQLQQLGYAAPRYEKVPAD